MKFGLWLAQVVLQATGQRECAILVPSLPDMVGRRCLFLTDPVEESPSWVLRDGRWLVWNG